MARTTGARVSDLPVAPAWVKQTLWPTITLPGGFLAWLYGNNGFSALYLREKGMVNSMTYKEIAMERPSDKDFKRGEQDG
jgi:hypothetical protein